MADFIWNRENGTTVSRFENLKIALEIPKEYMGNGVNLQEENLVQKIAMGKINYKIGRIMTTHNQPMLPCTA